jgi:hypothetical protein
MEPFTSLLIRETSIAAGAAGKLSRALWEISRVLRRHLQPDVECAKDGYQQGESGAESSEVSDRAPLLPFPDFGSGNEKDYD